MNRSNVAVYSVHHSNSEGLIEHYYCEYPLYLHPDISVETPIWTVVALLSNQYSILILRALLNVNIVNITVAIPWNFPWNFNMIRTNVAIYSVPYSNSEGLIARQYCPYRQYLYPEISGETPVWNLVTWPSIQYSLLIQRALLNVNIFNFHNRSNVAIYSVRYPNSEGLIERQHCQYPQYLYPELSVQPPIWTVVTWASIQYSILIQRVFVHGNIVNIHSICTLKFPVKLQYEP
jgi:hypothetical protein